MVILDILAVIFQNLTDSGMVPRNQKVANITTLLEEEK